MPDNINVLLVEDHALTRIGLKALLDRTEDIKVIGEATNGQEALELTLSLKPHIVLMDVGMPVMDGIEAVKKIKEQKSEAGIIMLTSHDNERDIFASLTAGAGGYCLKDVEPERLYTAIRSVHAGDAWLDAAIAGQVLKQYSSFFSNPAGGLAKPEAAKEKDDKSTLQPTAEDKYSNIVDPLSPRELEVLALIVEGLSNQEVSDRLFISLATTKTHVRNILNKLAVNDRTQAAVQAMRRGLV
ncbi:MAG: response regulator transcription factor [Candidatus Melainabacteria bacterium]|nr:response regulator transcription factor [Candidatus Melainabacteria bacterium]